MDFHSSAIVEYGDSREIYDYVIEGLDFAAEYEFPPKMTSSYSKAKYLKKHNPQYHKIPNSLMRGYFETGSYRSESMKGLRLKSGTVLHLWGLGNIHLKKFHPVGFKPKQVIFRPDYEIAFYGVGVKRSNTRIILKDYTTEDLTRLVNEDPIFRYLKVNQVFTEFGHKKAGIIRDVIHYFESNPNMTRAQLERYGIKGDRLWDLVVNYQPSLDAILRTRDKPKMQYKILSKGQYRTRLDKEWSLSEHMSNSDVDAGKLKKQSFDTHTYEAVRSDKWSFFQ